MDFRSHRNLYLLAIFAFLLEKGSQNGGFMMRVPGIDSPVSLSSQEAVQAETKLIESFKNLPTYKPLKLVDMDSKDPNYAAEVTRQILR